MSARPFSTYPEDRKTLLTYAASIANNWEGESMTAIEMADLVEAILTDEAVADEVKELAALVAERDALRETLEKCGDFFAFSEFAPNNAVGSSILRLITKALDRKVQQ